MNKAEINIIIRDKYWIHGNEKSLVFDNQETEETLFELSWPEIFEACRYYFVSSETQPRKKKGV